MNYTELKKQLKAKQVHCNGVYQFFHYSPELHTALLTLLEEIESDEMSDSDAYDADEKAARAYLESDEFNCSSKDTYTAACQHIRTTVVADLQKQLEEKDKEITLLRENAIASNEVNKILSRMPDKELMKEMADALKKATGIVERSFAQIYKRSIDNFNDILAKYNSFYKSEDKL